MKYSANSVWENKDEYDVVIVGAGHAGCEAALACARMGFQTLMFTVSVDSIALMPCNPNIGGRKLSADDVLYHDWRMDDFVFRENGGRAV